MTVLLKECLDTSDTLCLMIKGSRTSGQVRHFSSTQGTTVDADLVKGPGEIAVFVRGPASDADAGVGSEIVDILRAEKL